MKRKKRNARGRRGRQAGRTRSQERVFAGRVTAISASASEGINETRFAQKRRRGNAAKRDVEDEEDEDEAQKEEEVGKEEGGDGLAQIPHENSTIAHLPPVDTEHSRGALTYRVRHI